MRRIVTGHDASGRAVVLIDDAPSALVLEKAGGLRLTELWQTQETPARFAARDQARRERRIEPDPGGSVFRIIDYPPDRERLARIQPEAHFASMGVEAAPAEKRRHPGMHRTRTIDYAIILSGEIDMLLDDTEVHLKAGDILVQQATNHAWVNRGKEPCRICFVLIDGADPLV